MKYTSNHKALLRQGKTIYKHAYYPGIPGKTNPQWYTAIHTGINWKYLNGPFPDEETARSSLEPLIDHVNSFHFEETLTEVTE